MGNKLQRIASGSWRESSCNGNCELILFVSTDADFELCLIKFKCENCISLRSFFFCEIENSHQVAAPSEERIRIIKQNI